MAQVEPLPLVPATWTTVALIRSAPAAANSFSVLSSPSLIPKIGWKRASQGRRIRSWAIFYHGKTPVQLRYGGESHKIPPGTDAANTNKLPLLPLGPGGVCQSCLHGVPGGPPSKLGLQCSVNLQRHHLLLAKESRMEISNITPMAVAAVKKSLLPV